MYKSNSPTVFGAQTLVVIPLNCSASNKVLFTDLSVTAPLFPPPSGALARKLEIGDGCLPPPLFPRDLMRMPVCPQVPMGNLSL
jgi:hypothetical protein